MGQLKRYLTEDATVMVMVLDATDIVRRAEQLHHTSAVVTAALGRTLTAASMMGMLLKGKRDSVTLRVNGGGPIGGITAVADSAGNVRGYAANPVVELPLRPDGKLNVGAAVGVNGMLTISRDTGGKEPYIGMTPLVSGEIAEDVTAYYAQSEQTPTVCALGVLVNPDLTVKTAGGFLVQLLPFCPDGVIDKLEKNVAALDSMTAMLDRGMTPAAIAAKLLDGFSYNELDEAAPTYRCTCSREKLRRVLAGMDDVDSLLNEKGEVEAVCSFCNRVYTFSKAALRTKKQGNP